MTKIVFANYDVVSKLKKRAKVKNLIEYLFKHEAVTLKRISYVFCSDEFLLTLNKRYLNHDTLTDVITFPLSDTNSAVIAEIYISTNRVKENAEKFQVKYQDELLRVIIHSALHLCGYSDKRRLEKTKIRLKEDFYLNKFNVSRESDIKLI